jgi:hypothetical protein
MTGTAFDGEAACGERRGFGSVDETDEQILTVADLLITAVALYFAKRQGRA